MLDVGLLLVAAPLDEWDRIQQARQAELKRDVRRGLEQLDRGESAPLDMEPIKAKARLQRFRQ